MFVLSGTYIGADSAEKTYYSRTAIGEQAGYFVYESSASKFVTKNPQMDRGYRISAWINNIISDRNGIVLNIDLKPKHEIKSIFQTILRMYKQVLWCQVSQSAGHHHKEHVHLFYYYPTMTNPLWHVGVEIHHLLVLQ